MTKKILAVLLALAMLLSLCSVNVFAADPVDTSAMDVAFEWAAEATDTVEATWTNSSTILGDKNAAFIEALNKEGAYLEIVGHNMCNQHGAMVNVKFNDGEFAGYGYPVGSFTKGDLVSKILESSKKDAPITSVFFQLGLYNHEKEHTGDDFETTNHVYINGLKVYVPKADVEIPEPTDHSFVLIKDDKYPTSIKTTVFVYPEKDLSLTEFVNNVNKVTININGITATTDKGKTLTADDLNAIGKEDNFFIRRFDSICAEKDGKTTVWHPLGGSGGWSGTQLTDGNFSSENQGSYSTDPSFYEDFPTDTTGWNKVGFELYLDIDATLADATEYVVLNFDSMSVDVEYKTEPTPEVELPEGYEVVTTKTGENKTFAAPSWDLEAKEPDSTVVSLAQSEYNFTEDDYLVFTVVAAEGVDASKWQVGICETTTWKNIGAPNQGILTVSGYVKDILAATNGEVTIENLNSLWCQVWHAEIGQTVASWSVTIAHPIPAPGRGEEPKTYKTDNVLTAAVEAAKTEGTKVTVTPDASVKADGILVALKDGQPAEHAGKVTVNYKTEDVDPEPVEFEVGIYVGQLDANAPKIGTITVTDTPAKYTITNANAFSGDGSLKMIILKATAANATTPLKNVKVKTTQIKIGDTVLAPVDGNTMEYTIGEDGKFEIIYYAPDASFLETANNHVTVGEDVTGTTASITFIVDADNYVDPSPEPVDPSTPVSQEDLAKVNKTENTGTDVLGSFALTNYLPENLNGTLPANDSIVAVVKGSITNNSENEDAKVALRAYLTPASGIDVAKSTIGIISQEFGEFEIAVEIKATDADAKELQFKRGYGWKDPYDDGLSATFTFDSIGIFHGTLDDYNAATTATAHLPATIAATNTASEGPEVVQFAEGDYYVEVATNSEKEIESIVIEYTDAAATTAPALDYIKVLDPNADPNPPTPPTPPVYVPGGGVILDLGPEFHGLLQGGKLIPMAHIYNDFGVCTICGRIQPAEAETEGDEVVVDTPVEDTDNNAEEEGDDLTVTDPEPTTPAEKNPETGIALAVVPMLVAAAAVMATRKH